MRHRGERESFLNMERLDPENIGMGQRLPSAQELLAGDTTMSGYLHKRHVRMMGFCP